MITHGLRRPRAALCSPQFTRLSAWIWAAVCLLGAQQLLADEPAVPSADAPSSATATPAPAPAPALVPIEVKRPARTDTVDFVREILPFLQPNCLPCHNKTTSKGDLNLESSADMLKGGETGPAIVAGKAADSLLLQMASHAKKPRMPPKDNKVNATDLTPFQLGLLATWLDQGAHAGETSTKAVEWQAMATNFLPALAVAISPDGRIAASGRANQIHLYHLAEPSIIQRLEDPELGHGVAQRDVVSALAFSPDGEWLASGGFREARLWRRRPPQTAVWSAITNVVAAATAPTAGLVAISRDDGHVDLLLAADGTSRRTLPALDPPAQRLLFSPDERRLAGVNAHGTLRIWDLATGGSIVTQSGDASTTAIAWADGGRQIAVARQGQAVVQLYSVPVAESGELAFLRELSGHTQPVIALEDGSKLGFILVSASNDGSVRLWSPLPGNPPKALDIGTPVSSVTLLPGTRQLVVTTLTNGSQVWNLGDTPSLAAPLPGDPRLWQAVTNAERQLKFARYEVDFHSLAAKRAEDDLRKRGEESTRATEKHQGNEKALADKKQSLAGEEEKLATATRERNELTNALQQANNQLDAAQKAADAAKLAAQDTAARATQASLVAEQAARAHADLEHVLTNLTGKADETVLGHARNATDTAAKEAAAKAIAANDAKAAANKSIDELARLAGAAGEAKSAADRARTEVPPKVKQSEERLAAATKAVSDLKPQVEKARIQRDTSEADVQLTQRNLAEAGKSVEDAKASVATATLEFTNSVKSLEQMQATREAAKARKHRWVGSTGSHLLTLDETGTLATWSLPSGQPLAAVSLPADHWNFLEGSPGGAPLLHSTTGLVRLLPGGEWELAARIGTGDAMSPLVDRINAVAFSPDSRWLATGGGEPSRSGELKIWSVADGTLVHDLGGIHSDCVLSLAFSPKGDLLASGGADRFLRVSDPATGKVLRNFEGHTHHVLGVTWRADGRVLASAGGEGVVKIWNRLTGERLQNVEGFGKEVSAVQALGVAAEFLAVSGSGQARVFKENKEQIRTLPAGSAFLHALAVTPDGRLALAGGDDSIVRVWNVADGKVLFDLPPAPALGSN